MERSRLIVNFDSSCDKLLSTENVVASGETFDILFRDVTLSGTVRVAFWDHETLLWRSEGSASQRDGGSVLEGLVADTKELADVFRGGSGFFAARLTVGEQVGGDEWRDYGVAYVRLYRGTDPSENPEPARPDVYPTEDELNAWLEAAGEVREGVCTCAKAAASSAEAAASSARLASAQALDAVNTAARAKDYASDAANASTSAAKSYENAEASRKAAESAAQVAREARDNAQLQQQQAAAAAGNANGYRQQAQNAQRLAERAQEKAEEAQQAAETARDQAAQSAQEAGVKADEANQAAADAGSASSAAQAAKAAAAGSASSAAASATQAQAAKTGAETAKAGAETAKASAEAAAGQAASSATNAAGSATQAEEAKKAVEETEDWIGRVRLAPDSPIVVEWAAPCVKRINTLDDSLLAATSKVAVTTDGYHIIAQTYGKRPYKLYILGNDYKVQWSGELHVADGGATGRSLMAWVDDAGGFAITLTTRLTRWQLNADGTMTKMAEANIGSVWMSLYDNNNFIYNPLTGNVFIETIVPDPEVEGTAQEMRWLKFDGQMNLLGRADDVLPKGVGYPFFVFWDTRTATTGRRAYVVHKGPDDTYWTLKWLDAEDNFVEVHDSDGDPVYFGVNGSAVGLASGRAWGTPTISTNSLRNGFWYYQIQSYDENGVMVLKKIVREDIASNIPDYKAGTGHVYGIVNLTWNGQYGVSYATDNILSARPGLMMSSGFINLVGINVSQTPLGIQGVDTKDVIILSRNVLFVEE